MRPSALYPLRIRQSLRGHWDKLGPGTLLLQCLHRDTPHLQERNTKKLYGTKNNSGYAQLGQILDKRDQNTQLPLLKSLEQKQGVGTKSRVLHIPPAPPKGWANHLNHPSSPRPGHTPTLIPYEERTCACSRSKQASKGTCLFSLSQHPCFSRGTIKALPEFLVWPLVKFCQSGKVKNTCPYPEPVRHQNAGKSKH